MIDRGTRRAIQRDAANARTSSLLVAVLRESVPAWAKGDVAVAAAWKEACAQELARRDKMVKP